MARLATVLAWSVVLVEPTVDGAVVPAEFVGVGQPLEVSK
jgi:hypothetical protein